MSIKNQTAWDKHRDLMEWMYSGKGRSVICKYRERKPGREDHFSWSLTRTPGWSLVSDYLRNDSIVEARKAVSEGRKVNYLNDQGEYVPVEITDPNALSEDIEYEIVEKEKEFGQKSINYSPGHKPGISSTMESNNRNMNASCRP